MNQHHQPETAKNKQKKMLKEAVKDYRWYKVNQSNGPFGKRKPRKMVKKLRKLSTTQMIKLGIYEDLVKTRVNRR